MPHHVDQFVERLRSEPTPAEGWFWPRLEEMGGWVFQYPIALGGGKHAIVDFFHPESCVAVELDGSSHVGREDYDWGRDGRLLQRHVRVLRYSNEDACFDADRVMAEIRLEVVERRGHFELAPIEEVKGSTRARRQKDRRKKARASRLSGSEYRVNAEARRERQAAYRQEIADRKEGAAKRERMGMVEGIPIIKIPTVAAKPQRPFVTEDLCKHDIPAFACGVCK